MRLYYTKLPVFARLYASHRTGEMISIAKEGMRMAYLVFTRVFFSSAGSQIAY